MDTHTPNPGLRHRFRRGFTIVETTITIGIIALLASIVIYAVGKVRGQGDIVSERAMVAALQKAVERFKQEYNFLPPLVVDAPAGSTNPVTIASGQIQVWKTSDLFDPNTTVNGSTCNGDNGAGRKCYSIHSLAYYLAGALDVSYDGGGGLTFTAPTSDGQFSKRGRAHEAMVDLTQQKTRLGATRLYIANSTNPAAAQRVDCRIWDRWSVGTPGGASYEIRYYRWLPSFFPPGNANAGQVQYWNIPMEIGGNPTMNSLPPVKAELRTAEYAIVSAGPDHLFGDEGGVFNAKAAEDNIIEVGR